MSNDPILAWHFTGDTLRDGRPVPSPGEILTYDDGEVIMCGVGGLHASREPLDALRYAPGSMIHRVEVWGDVEERPDKLVGRHRRILWSADATDPLRAFSRWCASSVIDAWDAPDVVHQFLETGDEALRAATRAAAWDAAGGATRDAARSAAWASAWSAARDAAGWAAWGVVRASVSYAASYAAKAAAKGNGWVAARDAQNTKLHEMLIELKPVVTPKEHGR